MASYIVAPSSPTASIRTSFNDVAKVLKETKDVTLATTLDNLEMFVVEANEATAKRVEKLIPGWTFYPNSRIDIL